jgi:hypothetical protein
LVESLSTIELFKALRPSYTLPSRWIVGERLLNRVYSKVKAQVADELNGKNVSVIQDGVTTKNKQPLIAHAVSTGNKTFFIEAQSAEENSKTAEYCASRMKSTIEIIERDYNCKVIGGVTDNCPTMMAMHRMLRESIPTFHLIGCHAHLLNLVGKKLTPESISKQIVKVQNHFRNRDFESAMLSKLGGEKPKIPCDTRWNSQIASFTSFVKNQSKYLEVSRLDGSSLGKEISLIIKDDDLFQEVLRIIRVLEPVSSALIKVCFLKI